MDERRSAGELTRFARHYATRGADASEDWGAVRRMVTGLARIASRMRAAIADGTLVSPPLRAAGAEGLSEVPAALRLYAIEAPDLRRYDALLEAARCSA